MGKWTFDAKGKAVYVEDKAPPRPVYRDTAQRDTFENAPPPKPPAKKPAPKRQHLFYEPIRRKPRAAKPKPAPAALVTSEKIAPLPPPAERSGLQRFFGAVGASLREGAAGLATLAQLAANAPPSYESGEYGIDPVPQDVMRRQVEQAQAVRQQLTDEAGGDPLISAAMQAQAPLRGLSIIPAAAARKIQEAADPTLHRTSPLDVWEMTVAPQLSPYGQAPLLSSVGGRAAEERTGSKVAGQIGAAIGWIPDIVLSLDTLATLPITGGLTSRQMASHIAPAAAERATATAVRDGVIDAATNQEITGRVTSLLDNIWPKNVAQADKAATGAGNVRLRMRTTRTGRYAFEPQDLAMGYPETVRQTQNAVRAVVKSAAPHLPQEAVQEVTGRIVGSLQHNLSEGFRYQVPFTAPRRPGKAPLAAETWRGAEADMARAAHTTARAERLVGEAAGPPISAEARVATAEQYREGQISGIKAQAAAAEREKTLHLQRMRENLSVPQETGPTWEEQLQVALADQTAARRAESLARSAYNRALRSPQVDTGEVARRLDELTSAEQRLAQAQKYVEEAPRPPAPPAMELPQVADDAPAQTLREQRRRLERTWKDVRPLVEEDRTLLVQRLNRQAIDQGFTGKKARGRLVNPQMAEHDELLRGARVQSKVNKLSQAKADRLNSSLAEDLSGGTWQAYRKAKGEAAYKELWAKTQATGNIDDLLLHSNPRLTRSDVADYRDALMHGTEDAAAEMSAKLGIPDWADEIYKESLPERLQVTTGDRFTDTEHGVEFMAQADERATASAGRQWDQAAVDQIEEELPRLREELSGLVTQREEMLGAVEEAAKRGEMDAETAAATRRAFLGEGEDGIDAQIRELRADVDAYETAQRLNNEGQTEQATGALARTPRRKSQPQLLAEVRALEQKVQRGTALLAKRVAEDDAERFAMLQSGRRGLDDAKTGLREAAETPPVRPEYEAGVAEQTERLTGAQKARQQAEKTVGKLRARPEADHAERVRKTLAALPKRLQGTVEDTLQKLADEGYTISREVEGRLRTIEVNRLDRELDRLAEMEQKTLVAPYPEYWQRANREGMLREQRGRLGSSLKATTNEVRRNLIQGADLDSPVRERMRDASARAQAGYVDRGDRFAAISTKANLDPRERQIAGQLAELMNDWWTKSDIGYMAAGRHLTHTPEEAVTMLLRSLHMDDEAARVASFLGPDGRVLVETLPDRARRIWTATEQTTQALHEFFVGSPRLEKLGVRPAQEVMNALSGHSGGPPIGDLGPGYLLHSSSTQMSVREMRNIMEGLQPDVAQLSRSALARAEADQAAHARPSDRIAAMMANGQEPELAKRLPYQDMFELAHAWNLKQRQYEQLVGIYDVVRTHFPDVTKLADGQIARYTEAGWGPLRWQTLDAPPDEWPLVKGLENYLVSPAFQADTMTHQATINLNIFSRLLNSWRSASNIVKPWVLRTANFLRAQMVEQPANLLMASPYLSVRGAAKGWQYANHAIAREIALESGIMGSEELGDRMVGLLARKADELLSTVGSVNSKAEREAMEAVVDDYVKMLHSQFPIRQGMPAAMDREQLTAYHQAMRRLRDKHEALGVSLHFIENMEHNLNRVWFGADTFGRASLLIGLIESGESPQMARQILRTVSVEYGREMQAPVDALLQQVVWFERYTRHRTEQFLHVAKRNPVLIAVARNVHEKFPQSQGVDDQLETILEGRPGWMKSSPEWWPVSPDFPGADHFDPEKFPAVVAVDGPYQIYMRMRIPFYETISDALKLARQPIKTVEGKLPPPYQTVKAWEAGKDWRKTLPVAGQYYRKAADTKPAEADPDAADGSQSTRPAPEPGVYEAARASKQLWEDDPALAAQYEQEKTRLLALKWAARTWKGGGASVDFIFLDDCIKRLTPKQLRKLEAYAKQGQGYVPLYKEDETGEKNGVSIEEELERRAAGVGPKTVWDQMEWNF